MSTDVRRYVSQCSTCQQIKYVTKKSVGLLQPLPTPAFISLGRPFPGFRHMLTSFQWLCRYLSCRWSGAHYGALPAQFTAYKTACLFLDIICKLHGFPRSLVSDKRSLVPQHLLARTMDASWFIPNFFQAKSSSYVFCCKWLGLSSAESLGCLQRESLAHSDLNFSPASVHFYL